MDDERPISDIMAHIDEMEALLKELLTQYQDNGNGVDEDDNKSQCLSVSDVSSTANLKGQA